MAWAGLVVFPDKGEVKMEGESLSASLPVRLTFTDAWRGVNRRTGTTPCRNEMSEFPGAWKEFVGRPSLVDGELPEFRPPRRGVS